jgi:hypothetical protein
LYDLLRSGALTSVPIGRRRFIAAEALPRLSRAPRRRVSRETRSTPLDGRGRWL